MSPRLRGYTAVALFFAFSILFCLVSHTLQAQNVTGALTGTVADSSGAVVVGAAIGLKNDSSGDIRKTVSNSDGYFTIAAIPPGNYSVTVEAQGFVKWQRTGVIFNAGDKRNLADIVLAVASANETVTVEASAEQITTVDSGEKSEGIGTKQIQ